MKILLINNNPVVSRLTALSARKEDIEIDEIQEVTELNSDTYDIVFVDADSWTKDVRDVITENIKTKKSVLFYSDGDEEEKASFDLSILKPFLPSEVSAVIRSVEEQKEDVSSPALASAALASTALASTSTEEEHFNILDEAKVENRNELFELDGLDEIEEKKEEVAFTLDKSIKDESINLELEDMNFDDKLEESFPLKINTIDDDLFEETASITKIEEKETEKENDDLFDLDLSDEIPSLEDDLFTDKLDDDILEVSTKNNEVSSLLTLDDELALEVEAPVLEEVKIETQILDELEIENIKGILTEDSSDDMTLEDLMPSMALMPTLTDEVETKEQKEEEQEKKALKEEKKKEKQEKKKLKEEASSTPLDLDSNVLAQTLVAMPVENLRQLLAGATVNIQIKFPKSKK